MPENFFLSGRPPESAIEPDSSFNARPFGRVASTSRDGVEKAEMDLHRARAVPTEPGLHRVVAKATADLMEFQPALELEDDWIDGRVGDEQRDLVSELVQVPVLCVYRKH